MAINTIRNEKKSPKLISLFVILAVFIAVPLLFNRAQQRRLDNALKNTKIDTANSYKVTETLRFEVSLDEVVFSSNQVGMKSAYADETNTLVDNDLVIEAEIKRVTNNKDVDVPLSISKVADSKYEITSEQLQDILTPGKYELVLNLEKGNATSSITQDFSWGVLALNTNKSVYSPNENAKIHLAVLDEEGMMVCDAGVTLKIIDPAGKETELSTSNNKIIVNPGCQLKKFILEPDYETSYQTQGVGVYRMILEAETDNGRYSIEDSFEVREYVPFDIERITATRIYPPENYPVRINIIANEDFAGTVTEFIPEEFEIINNSSGSVVRNEGDSSNKLGFVKSTEIFSSNDTALITTRDGIKEVRWDVNIKKGEEIRLEYTYDAPEISPEFYLLGPLRLKSYTLDQQFEELRQWQIASDAISYAKSNSTATSTTTPTASLTATADNLVVFFCGVQSNKTITGPGGSWNTIYNESGAQSQGMFYKISAGGSEAPSCSYTGADSAYAAIIEYSGVETSAGSILDTNNTASGSGDATVECPSVTPSAGNHVYVSGFIFDGEDTSSVNSWSNTFNQREQPNYTAGPKAGRISGGVADKITTGPQSTTATMSISGAWRCHTAAFNEDQITVTGRVFTDDDEVTTLNSQSICAVVNNGTPDCSTTDGSGYFTIAHTTAPSANAQITVFLDGGTNFGNTVTISDGTDILTADNFRVYQNHVLVRYEQGSDISIVDMDAYDSDQNSTDMLYDAEDLATDTLSVNSPYELYVPSGYTFTPTGNVTQVHDIEIDGTWTTAASETINVNGTFKLDSAGTFNYTSSVVTFDGTAGTEDIITLGTGGFYDLTINDGGNSLTVEVEDPLTVYGDLTITGGTLDVVSGENNQINVMTNWDNDDTFEARNGTVVMDGSGAATYTIDAVGTGNYAFYDLTFNDSAGGATYQLTTDLDVDDDITITGGTLDSNGNDIYVGGDWTNDDTFTEGTNTVYLDTGTSAVLDSGCSDADTCTNENFYNLSINKGTGGDVVTITNTELRVTNTLTITAGELVQTTQDVRLEGATALQLYDFGRYSNLSTGNITLGGNVINDYGSITLNSNGAACGDADSITLTSTAAAARAWSGNGAFRITDINLDWMSSTPTIRAASSTEGANMAANWEFVACNMLYIEGLDFAGVDID